MQKKQDTGPFMELTSGSVKKQLLLLRDIAEINGNQNLLLKQFKI